ncbi:hypothetical protein CJ209_11420 [Fusobacterium nucleatum]|uniref:Uncharacterized protein n=1 Tax=Fusobacterium nucleatum TaxID=851 RepID=A0A2N6TEU5_FUSNU|nr:hypothetical protein [Fusobacterium nucleatum]PMC67840.1 hypothetical protein CJ209_11420 [Fusobacterium nucleatum]
MMTFLLVFFAIILILSLCCRYKDKINNYNKENIKLRIYDDSYAYIYKEFEFLFPKRHEAVLKLYKVGSTVEYNNVDTGYIRIKQDLTGTKKAEEVAEKLFNDKENSIKSKIYLYKYEIYDENYNKKLKNIINDIKINIKNLHVHIDNVNISKQGNLQELERKIDLLNSKIDILNNNLNKDFIQEMLELASSIPGMEVIAKLLEKLYEMLK